MLNKPDVRLLIVNALLSIFVGKLAKQFSRNKLIVLNYHRICRGNDAKETPFDDGVFGPTVNIFKKQMEYLKANTIIIGENDLIDILNHQKYSNITYSLVTFDDGYIDNYTLALPVMKELKIPGIFFVPVECIENRNLGWWDKIAYMVKNSNKDDICMNGININIKMNRSYAIYQLLKMVKNFDLDVSCEMVKEIEDKLCARSPSINVMDKEIMTWDQLKSAGNSGITIGSHTLSHRLLSNLSESEQLSEIKESKIYLENKLKKNVKSISYPVGGVTHYNATSMLLAEKVGYHLGFTFHFGDTRLGHFNKFAIPRLSVPNDFKTFRARIHFPKIMNYK